MRKGKAPAALSSPGAMGEQKTIWGSMGDQSSILNSAAR
jgi:hypothetical protein